MTLILDKSQATKIWVWKFRIKFWIIELNIMNVNSQIL